MPAPDRARQLRWAELAVLVGCGLWALAFQLRVPGRLPTEAQYEQLAAYLQQNVRPGDAVLLFPWWTERARLHVPDGIPVVGYLGSDADPLVPYPRVWLISQPELPGNRAADFEKAFLPGRTVSDGERAFGALRVTGYRNGRHRPRVFSLTDVLPEVKAAIVAPSGERTPCVAEGRGHRCANRTTVQVEWHEVVFEPRRCVFLQPPGGERQLVLELPPLPRAEQWSLEAGYIWDRGWHHGPTLTPSTIRLEDATGRALIDLPMSVGLEGIQRAKLDALPDGPLRITVQSRNPELRELCVDLFGYGAAAP